MKKYVRILLGDDCIHATKCFLSGIIGTDYNIRIDLGEFPDDLLAFCSEVKPHYLESNPDKEINIQEIDCHDLFTFAKGIATNDIVLAQEGMVDEEGYAIPNSANRYGQYRVGIITGSYYYESSHPLPHRRRVQWLDTYINQSDMSEALRYSLLSCNSISNVSHHRDELDKLIASTYITSLDQTNFLVNDVSAITLGANLNNLLIDNWSLSSLSKEYDICVNANQSTSEYGSRGILAISKDMKRLLVVEIMNGSNSDVIIGQTLHQMGFVQDQVAQVGQDVLGAIVGYDDAKQITRALMFTRNITYYRCDLSFRLVTV